MTNIERIAKELALERQPDYMKPPFDEAKAAQFFLSTREGLDYDAKAVLAELERESEKDLERRATQIVDELADRIGHVKKLITKAHVPEYAPDVYEKRSTSHFGGEDIWVRTGYGKPKLVRWNAVLKDPYPESNLTFRPKDWLDWYDWLPYLDKEDYQILHEFDREFTNRRKLVGMPGLPEIDHVWNVYLTFRPKGEDK